nr:15743_t:CDS:2 [Entrophospora candida]
MESVIVKLHSRAFSIHKIKASSMLVNGAMNEVPSTYSGIGKTSTDTISDEDDSSDV